MSRKSTAISLVLIGTTAAWFGCDSRAQYRPTTTDTSAQGYRSGYPPRTGGGFWTGYWWGRSSGGGYSSGGGSSGGSSSHGTVGGTSRGGFGASGHASG